MRAGRVMGNATWWFAATGAAAVLLVGCADSDDGGNEIEALERPADDDDANDALADDANDDDANSNDARRDDGPVFDFPQDGTELSDDDAAAIVAVLDEENAATVRQLVADNEVSDAVRERSDRWRTAYQFDAWVEQDLAMVEERFAEFFRDDPGPPFADGVEVHRAFEDCVEVTIAVRDLTPLLVEDWEQGPSPWVMTLRPVGDDAAAGAVNESGWLLDSQSLVSPTTGERRYGTYRDCEP